MEIRVFPRGLICKGVIVSVGGLICQILRVCPVLGERRRRKRVAVDIFCDTCDSRVLFRAQFGAGCAERVSGR